uniref:Uncharacterized protein n=1 Tax=Anopheles coluzzii TaxID=1518534 RepID=A0A8W7PR11_ANOCL
LPQDVALGRNNAYNNHHDEHVPSRAQHGLPPHNARPAEARPADHRRRQCRAGGVLHPALSDLRSAGQRRVLLPADGGRLPGRDVLSARLLSRVAQHRRHHLEDDLRAGVPYDRVPALPDRLDHAAGGRHQRALLPHDQGCVHGGGDPWIDRVRSLPLQRSARSALLPRHLNRAGPKLRLPSSSL